jgi:hypothetical protein
VRHMSIIAAAAAFMACAATAQAHETINHPVSPTQNVANSARYSWLVHHSPAFRHRRMIKECGPLRNDEGLYHDCIDSFYR